MLGFPRKREQPRKNLDGRGKIQFDNTDRTLLEAVAAALGYGNDRVHEHLHSASATGLSAKRGYPSLRASFRLYLPDVEAVKKPYTFVRSKEKRAKLKKRFPFICDSR